VDCEKTLMSKDSPDQERRTKKSENGVISRQGPDLRKSNCGMIENHLAAVLPAQAIKLDVWLVCPTLEKFDGQ
jgi:hypothetical protein